MHVPVFYRKDRLRCFPELKMPARGGHDDKTILGLDDIVNRQSKISSQDLAQFLNADKHSPASSAQSTKWRVRGMLMSALSCREIRQAAGGSGTHCQYERQYPVLHLPDQCQPGRDQRTERTDQQCRQKVLLF